MKKALLITPKSKSVPYLEGYDYIGVDSGSLLILEHGYPLSFSVGDFDSMESDCMDQIREAGPVYQHPVMKNETDSELACRLCIEKGYGEIILWGAISGRLDHTLSNIQLLLVRSSKIRLMDEFQSVMILDPGQYVFDPDYHHVSFFAIKPSCISLDGFLYPLCHQDVQPTDMYLVSNTIVGSRASVNIHRGRFLCVQSNYK